MRYFLILFSFFCFQSILMAQNVRFDAQVSTKTVAPNGRFELTFSLEEAKPDRAMNLPSLSDFMIESGPNQSQQMQMINGNVTSSVSISYVLRPKRQGTFVIGEATVQAKGQLYKTQPISIEVTNQWPNNGAVTQGKPTRDKGEVFLFPALSTKEMYIGEPLVIDYKLYSTMALEQIKPITIPSYTGFYQHQIKNFTSNEQAETVNGKRYASKVLFRNLLYPNQTGTLNIEAFELQAMTLGFGLDVIEFGCDEVSIKVKELPSNAPSDFSGAVGQWRANASVPKNNYTTDDIIPIRIILTGNGDLKRVQPQAIVLPNGIKGFDPKVITEQNNEDNGTLENVKEIEYLVQANAAGNYNIEPTFSYFNTATKSYETIKMKPVELHISNGIGTSLTDDNTAQNDNTFGQNKTSKYLKISGLLLSLLGLGYIGFVFWKRKKEASKPRVRAVFVREDIEDTTPRHSYMDERTDHQYMPIDNTAVVQHPEITPEITTPQHIETNPIEVALQKGDSDGFYKEINLVLQTIAAERYHIAPDSMTKEQILQQSARMNEQEDTSQTFIRLWDAAQMARYAGAISPERMQTHWELMQTLLKKLS